eukprot:TRINITY_DN12050_c0_g1_i1.p1 TRINITY_DN12050_c0_g1~~TRINITY_DN12050_c0_g1_i1.p1  ORF type:complete len:960 (+),score=156.13 TRINITY_DN12050_c0_g1_i1:65-2881(+)
MPMTTSLSTERSDSRGALRPSMQELRRELDEVNQLLLLNEAEQRGLSDSEGRTPSSSQSSRHVVLSRGRRAESEAAATEPPRGAPAEAAYAYHDHHEYQEYRPAEGVTDIPGPGPAPAEWADRRAFASNAERGRMSTEASWREAGHPHYPKPATQPPVRHGVEMEPAPALPAWGTRQQPPVYNDATRAADGNRGYVPRHQPPGGRRASLSGETEVHYEAPMRVDAAYRREGDMTAAEIDTVAWLQQPMRYASSSAGSAAPHAPRVAAPSPASSTSRPHARVPRRMPDSNRPSHGTPMPYSDQQAHEAPWLMPHQDGTAQEALMPQHDVAAHHAHAPLRHDEAPMVQHEDVPVHRPIHEAVQHDMPFHEAPEQRNDRGHEAPRRVPTQDRPAQETPASHLDRPAHDAPKSTSHRGRPAHDAPQLVSFPSVPSTAGVVRVLPPPAPAAPDVDITAAVKRAAQEAMLECVQTLRPAADLEAMVKRAAREVLQEEGMASTSTAAPPSALDSLHEKVHTIASDIQVLRSHVQQEKEGPRQSATAPPSSAPTSAHDISLMNHDLGRDMQTLERDMLGHLVTLLAAKNNISDAPPPTSYASASTGPAMPAAPPSAPSALGDSHKDGSGSSPPSTTPTSSAPLTRRSWLDDPVFDNAAAAAAAPPTARTSVALTSSADFPSHPPSYLSYRPPAAPPPPRPRTPAASSMSECLRPPLQPTPVNVPAAVHPLPCKRPPVTPGPPPQGAYVSTMTVANSTASGGHAPRTQPLASLPPDYTVDGLTPLLIACHEHDVEAVRRLVVDGANLEAADSDGWTPLHVAAQQGSESITEALLDGRCNVEARDCDGSTPLIIAAHEGRHRVVQMLLAAGADHARCDDDGLTPLMVAAQAGAEGCVEALLQAGAFPATTDRSGQTALSYACAHNGSARCVKLLEGAERVCRNLTAWG